MIRRECGQRLLQFSIQRGIGQFDALHVCQRERAEPVFCQERDIFLLDDTVLRALADGLRFLFHAQQRADDGIGRGDFNRFPTDLSQNLSQGRIAVQIDAEAAERFGHGIARTVGDGRDSAATEVLHDQTLQHVVDLVRMQAEVELRSVVHRAVMLKIPHAAGIEHDLREGERRSFLCQNRPGEQQE